MTRRHGLMMHPLVTGAGSMMIAAVLTAPFGLALILGGVALGSGGVRLRHQAAPVARAP
jgi:hypothetical protein